MAEEVGFEPTVSCPTTDFKSVALNRTQPFLRKFCGNKIMPPTVICEDYNALVICLNEALPQLQLLLPMVFSYEFRPKWSRVSDSNRRRVSPPLYKSGAVATEPTRHKLRSIGHSPFTCSADGIGRGICILPHGLCFCEDGIITIDQNVS